MNEDEQVADYSLRIVALLKTAISGDVDGYEALNPPSEPNSELVDALVGFLLASVSVVAAGWGFDLETYITSLQTSALETAKNVRGDTA